MGSHISNIRPAPDAELVQIADYVMDYVVQSDEAYNTARYCLMDTMGCGLLALKYPECTKLMGPIVPGAVLPGGARVPGTNWELEPVQAAFNIGCMIRWLDFNDTWLAAEWGHPSDNLGGILATADYVSRQRIAQNKQSLTVRDVLTAMIKAHEIQGVYAIANSFNRLGLDHVILVRIASTAVVTALMGGTREQVIHAVSNAWLDGGALRTYRHAPNTGSRKSWAAGDATHRAVRHALFALKNEMGYPSALTATQWGFYDVVRKGKPFEIGQSFASYVMEHVLFKISFPAEFHAQTAVECAFKLHPQVKDRLNEIKEVRMETHESAIRIIDKKGPLNNPADRDHCLQYMTAIGLIFGALTADHYEDDVAKDPRIDALREKMVVTEEPRYTKEYLDPDKRSIANAVQIVFNDGSTTDRVEVEYPVGHRRRREEGIPLLVEKFNNALLTRFSEHQTGEIMAACEDMERLSAMPVPDFMELFIP